MGRSCLYPLDTNLMPNNNSNIIPNYSTLLLSVNRQALIQWLKPFWHNVLLYILIESFLLSCSAARVGTFAPRDLRAARVGFLVHRPVFNKTIASFRRLRHRHQGLDSAAWAQKTWCAKKARQKPNRPDRNRDYLQTLDWKSLPAKAQAARGDATVI